MKTIVLAMIAGAGILSVASLQASATPSSTSRRRRRRAAALPIKSVIAPATVFPTRTFNGF